MNTQGWRFYTRIDLAGDVEVLWIDLAGDVEVLWLCPAVVVDQVVKPVATLGLTSPPV